MKKELEEKIYAIDPVFFREKDMDMTKTCMCWGLECGDGWFEPVKRLAEKASLLNQMLAPLNMCVNANQIKSKFAEFRCYWSMNVLDARNDYPLTDEQQDLIDTAYRMMDDAVDTCERECSQTCELCGKTATFNDEMTVCGSWLTVKCIDCAQKEQRKAGKITNFRDGFMFLSPFAKESIRINNVRFPTVIGAHYGTMRPEYEQIFSDLSTPSEVQSVAMNLGICRDDEQALANMRKVLLARYAEPSDEMYGGNKARDRLLSTKGLEIVQLNHSHENFWGSCCCKDCEGKGQNLYGKMLMEIRDTILRGEIPQND